MATAVPTPGSPVAEQIERLGTLHTHVRPEPRPDADAALAHLEAQVADELRLLGHRRDWVPAPPPGEDLRVLVIGGGHAGLGVAFALQRRRIDGVLVVDDQPADTVGCWARYARMHTLRSPKHMKGLELDCPSLHIERWFTARYGADAWASIDLIPRLDWHEYLRWYRRVTGVVVRHSTRVVAVHRPETADGPFWVELEELTTGERSTLTARRIVFAAGLDGGGGPQVPAMIRALPRDRWVHTEEEYDPARFAGKRVAVLGGGASGFDNAGAALEAGAAETTVFLRRSEVPRTNSLRWMEFPGMQEHFPDLPDDAKWDFAMLSGGMPQPPTQQTVWRCFASEKFRLEVQAPWTSVEVVERSGATPSGAGADIEGEDSGTELRISTPRGNFRADVVISATGYVVDLSLRPELAEFVDDIATWKERYEPAASHPLGACPYLGAGFEFQARETDTAGAADDGDGGGVAPASYLSRLYHFSTGARVSMGITGHQLSGLFGGLHRLAWSISSSVTAENWPTLVEEFRSSEYVEVDTVGPHRDADPWFAPGPRY